MSIVLSILQILGIILLVLLLLTVVLVLFVLFAPFSYQIEGKIHETKWVKARASWLLHLIRVKISYENDLIYAEAWLFWKRSTFSYEFTQKTSEEDKKKKTSNKGKEKAPHQKSIIQNVQDFISRCKDNYPRIKRIITDDRNKQAVAHLKKELFYLIKILLPKHSTVNAEFSTGSPDTTGQLCGVLACLPVMYQKGWTLRPDFTAEEGFFLGDFRGKGRLYMFQLVGIFLRILFDKNCRRMYTMIDRFKKRTRKKQSQEGK